MAFTWPWEDVSCDYVVVGDSVVVENDICYMIATPHTLNQSGWVRFDFLSYNYNGKIDIVWGFLGDGVEITNTEILDNESWISANKKKDKEKYNHVGLHDWQNIESVNVKKDNWYSVRAWVEIPFSPTARGKYAVGIMPSGYSVAQAQATGNLYLIDPWYESDWRYRKEITINNAGVDMHNYQVAFDVNQGAGVDAGWSVFCGGNCQADFEDIRFTSSDGNLQSIWREEYTNGGDATFWVELNDLHTGDNTYYIYYGNVYASYPYLATDSTHGETTFIVFDDFERGADGDEVGGDWTEVQGSAEISTTQDLGNVAGYYGTRSMEVSGFAAQTVVTIPITHSDNIAIRLWHYKETAAEIFAQHGDATDYMYIRIETDEDIMYYDGAWQDSGHNANADTWEMYEFRDFDWTGDTYDIVYWPGGVETVAQDDAGMNPAGAGFQDIHTLVGDGIANRDTWDDNYLVRNYRESDQPTVTLWGAEEANPGVSATHSFTGIGRDWVILNSMPEALGNTGVYVAERGFDYGMDTTYGSSWAETGVWPLDHYSAYIDGLLPNTLYHYRGKTMDDTGSWGYGFDRVFVTDSANILYENINFSDEEDGEDIYSGQWEYQTFTTDNSTVMGSCHTVKSVKIYAQRTGNPGILTVSIRKATEEEPKTIVVDDLCSGTIDADNFETTPTWHEIEMIPEVTLELGEEYAVLVRALSGDDANDVQWRICDGNRYDYGVAGTSTDGGSSWTPSIDDDHLFEIWGKEALEVQSAKVYQGYLEEDDWLITCLYLNEFAPYEEQGFDPEEYFYLQLYSDNVTIAQTRCPEWGLKPGQIYLSAAQITPLNWGDNYRVRIWGDFGGNPYREYELQPADWVGVDLTRLDMYVMNNTTIMENYYFTELTTYITNKGRVLNDEGAIIWQIGCPMLMEQRGHLFATTINNLTPVDDTWTNSMQTTLDFPTAMGTYLTGAFTDFGSVFNLSGRITAGLLAFVIFALVASLAFGTGHAIAGMAIGSPILIAAVWGGSILIVVLGVIVAFAILLLVWQFIWKGA